jgi:HK97 family phage major capsid protein
VKKLTEDQIKNFIAEPQSRQLNVSFDKAEDVERENMIIWMTVSSDAPYKRFFGYESLIHSKDAIDLSRVEAGAAFRDSHDGDQLAVSIGHKFIKGEDGFKKLKLGLRFSKHNPRAVMVFNEIVDEIRKNCSIRYSVQEMVLAKETEDELYYNVTKWELIHAATVPDPADYFVGFGRGLDATDPEKLLQLINEANKNHELKLRLITNKPEGETMKDPAAPGAVDNVVQIKEARDIESKRVMSIIKLARDFQTEVPSTVDLQKEATAFIEGEKSSDEFSNFILSQVKTKAATQTPLGNADEADDKDLINYSIIRAIEAGKYIRGGVSPDRLPKDFKTEIGLSRSLEKKTGLKAKGIFIPNQIMKSQRDMLTTGQGQHFIATDLLSGQLIEPLRNKMVTTRMGATYLEGLHGDVSIPKLTGSATFSWRSTETTTITDTTPTTGVLSLTPKFGSAAVDISDALLVQSSVDVEALIRKDLNLVKAIGIDLAALFGTGADGQPAGLAGTSGIGSVDIASMDWAAAVEFESDIDSGNAMESALNFATTPSVRGTLKSRAKETGYPNYIVSENNMMNGYPVFTSNQITANNILFGNWEHLIIAEWGLTDLIVDPYTGARSGLIQLTLKVMVDIGVRYAAAFSKGANFS